MDNISYKTYSYRWVMLVAYMAAVVINQLLWITFAPITKDAAAFYQVSDLSIGLLSLVFMVVYLVISFPASWIIDRYGLRVAIGIGAVLTGVFGMMRGIFSSNYNLVLVAQIGIAIGQPFILNAVTTVVARWFPIRERATAVGLGSLAIYLGIFLGLVATPFLVLRTGFTSMLNIYGISSVIIAILFILLSRERPLTPPCPPEMETKSLVVDGMKQIFRSRGFLLLLVIFFIGLGTFNAVTTWIEDIVRPRGFTNTQAGVMGGLMIAGGIVGALVIPVLSDKRSKRVPFIIIALAGAALGLLGVTLATSYPLALFSSAVLGFFLLSSGPIGFQYGAEITHPIPEGTSNGLLLLMGQISGIIFIVAMDLFKSPTGSMTIPLLVLFALMVVSLIISFKLKEPVALINSVS